MTNRNMDSMMVIMVSKKRIPSRDVEFCHVSLFGTWKGLEVESSFHYEWRNNPNENCIDTWTAGVNQGGDKSPSQQHKE